MLSPKQIGTICFAISILISAPLFATDISSSASTADCKYTPLQVYSGTSNLEAGWQANTIQLHWYNGDTEIQNVPSASQSCVYDGTLTPPATIPTKTGYTFKGWRVRQSGGGQSGGGNGTPVVTCDVTNLGDYSGVCGSWAYDYWAGEYPNDDDDVAACGLTEDNTWAVDYSNGRIYGRATCDYAQCLCEVTGYVINGGSFCSFSDLTITYGTDYFVSDDPDTQAESCWSDCARYCAENFDPADSGIYNLIHGIQ